MSDNRTIELIRLLEERGVKCEVIDFFGVKAVVWDGNVCRWVALPDEGGLAVAVYEDYLTPKQAIAATLGSEREKALEELVRSLYADYYNEWPDRAEEAYTERMKELGIEVIDE